MQKITTQITFYHKKKHNFKKVIIRLEAWHTIVVVAIVVVAVVAAISAVVAASDAEN